MRQPSLTACGFFIHRLGLAQVVFEHPGPDQSTTCEVRQIGADLLWGSVGRQTLEGVTGIASLIDVDRLPSLFFCRLRGVGRERLGLQPGVEVLFRVNEHFKAHPGVLNAAQFRARALVTASLLSVEHQVAHVAGNHVDLARQPWHPKIVDDVCGLELEVDLGVDRDVDFVGAHDACIRILDFPPPLVSAHDDVGRSVGEGIRVARRADRHPEDDDDDSERNRSPDNLDPDVLLLNRIGRLLAAGPLSQRTHNGVRDDSRNHDENNCADPQNCDEQIRDGGCLGTDWVKHAGTANRGVGLLARSQTAALTWSGPRGQR